MKASWYSSHVSDEIAREIDDEIRRVIEEAHETATRVLREHMDELHRLSVVLIERETIDKEQFEKLLAGVPEDEVFAGKRPSHRPASAKRPRSRLRRPRAPEPSPMPGLAMRRLRKDEAA